MFNVDKVLIGMVGLLLALTIVVGCLGIAKPELPDNSEVCGIKSESE